MSDEPRTVTLDLGDLIMLHAMARTVPGVNEIGKEMLARTKALIDAIWAEEAKAWAEARRPQAVCDE